LQHRFGAKIRYLRHGTHQLERGFQMQEMKKTRKSNSILKKKLSPNSFYFFILTTESDGVSKTAIVRY